MSVKSITFGLFFSLTTCLALAQPRVAGDPSPKVDRSIVSSTVSQGDGVWLCPLPDFEQLFESDGPMDQWDKIAKHVKVVRFTAGFFKQVPDEVLARIVKDLNRKHIAIGCQILALNWVNQPDCGKGVEGYGDPGQAKMVVEKIQKAGGRLDIISMDEPLWFGHYYDGKNCCHSSIDNIAQRTASIVKVYTEAFPDLVVGDTEAFPSISNEPHWKADYHLWCHRFQQASGRPLAFLQMDFNWGNQALREGAGHQGINRDAIGDLARQVADVARNNGLKVGFMYTGAHADTDQEWVKQAKQHMNIVEGASVNPDQAIFITWTKAPSTSGFRPEKLMPDSDNGTLGSLVQYYTSQFGRK